MQAVRLLPLESSASFVGVLLQLGKFLMFSRLLLASSTICFVSHAWAGPPVTVGIGGVSGNFLGRVETSNSGGWAEGKITYDALSEDFGLGIHAKVAGGGGGLRLDGSYVERQMGEWTYGLGAVERQWSPSRHSSMILSTNARPFPAAYVEKRAFSTLDAPLLAWVGPWKADMFLGQTEGDINPDHTKLFGVRLQLQPFDRLELELVRTSQWGGKGHSESLTTFINMLLGKTNEGAAADVNQLGGIGISYRLPQDFAPIRLYAQAVGEDEAGNLPSCFMYLGGVEGKAQVLGNPTVITLEGASTEIARTSGGFCGAGTAYNNGSYAGGYTNFGESMGLAIDSDGRMVQMILETQLPNLDLNWSLAYHEINKSNNPAHRLTTVPQNGMVARVGATRKIENFSVTGEVWYQSYDLDRANVRQGAGVSLGLSMTF